MIPAQLPPLLRHREPSSFVPVVIVVPVVIRRGPSAVGTTIQRGPSADDTLVRRGPSDTDSVIRR